MNNSRSLYAGAFVAFAVLSAGLLWSANGHPYLRDSAELTTATATGGIGHPTGFPAVHSASGVVRNLPLGPVSFRMVLLSVVTALLSVLFMGLAARSMARTPQGTPDTPEASGLAWVAISLVAGTSFLLTDTIWHHSTNLEMYMPLVATVGAAFWLALLVIHQGIPGGAWNLLGLLSGFSVGIHGEAMLLCGLLLAASFLIVLFKAGQGRGRLFLQALWPAFPLFLAGVASVVYLPIRSMAGTPMDWGQTSTLAGFWDHMTAATIRGSFANQMMPGASGLMVNVGRYAGQVWEQSGPMVLVGLVGLAVLLRRRWVAGVLAALLWGGDLFFSVVMNPMAQLELQTSTVTFWLVHLLAAYVAQELASGDSAVRKGVAIAGLALSAAWNVVAPADRSWRSGAAGYELGLQAWNQVPAGGVLLTNSDELSGQSLYLRLVEHRRPDIVHGVRQMICDPAFLRLASTPGGLAGQHTAFLAEQGAEVCERVGRQAPPTELWLAYLAELRTTKSPVVWEVGGAGAPDEQMASAFATPGFPAFPLDWSKTPDQQFTVEQWLAPISGWLLPRLKKQMPDQLTGWVLAEFMAQLTTRAAPTTAQQRDMLLGFLKTAVSVGPTSCKARNNLMAQQLAPDTIEEAVRFGQESLVACPDHMLLRVNQLRALLLTARYPEARQQLDKLRELFPADLVQPRIDNLKRQLSSMRLQDAAAILDGE